MLNQKIDLCTNLVYNLCIVKQKDDTSANDADAARMHSGVITMQTNSLPQQAIPTTQDYQAVDAAFGKASKLIMKRFTGMELFRQLDRLDEAMLPVHPADQLARINELTGEIAASASENGGRDDR